MKVATASSIPLEDQAAFTAAIDWDLIDAHLPDMLRVALSVKAGRLLPSAILRDDLPLDGTQPFAHRRRLSHRSIATAA